MVDVVPSDRVRRVDAEDAAVEAAAELQYGGARVRGNELTRPDVEMFRPHGQRDGGSLWEMKRLEVVVQAADDVAGERVPQAGVVGTAVERLAVERRKEGLLLRRQVNLFALHRLRSHGRTTGILPCRSATDDHFRW